MRAKGPAAQLLLFADDTQLQTDVDNLTYAHNAVRLGGVGEGWAEAQRR